MNTIVGRLDTMRDEMRGKHLTLEALEELRTGILSGERIELPSAQRQHLERGSPLISEVSFDARHRPISTNVSRHFQHLRRVGEGTEVRLHLFLPLKKSGKAGASSLMVIIDDASKLSVFSLEGELLLDALDLGHGEGRAVTQMQLSQSLDNHFVMTADEQGEVRVHNLKVVSRTRKAEAGEGEAGISRELSLSSNFSCAFTVPTSTGGEARKLNTMLPIDRGSQTYFVTGDSSGGIAVFYRNGTMKGRVRVTEDPGGVKGLLRSQGQMILFYSSHSFGFFSATQIDVQYPPCSGWNSPLVDVVIDPSHQSSRVVLSLADGDVLVFSTVRGKAKACDLTLKFPHVSVMPFKLQAFRGHIMALPTSLEETDRKADYLREIYFFNLGAMEAGYGVAPSRAVALQASFKPLQPEAFQISSPGGGGGASDRTKVQVAIKFAGAAGVELYDLSLKQPTAAKAGGGGGGGGEGGAGGDSWINNLLNWFPKVGVFGVALVGVVIWNVRKVANQNQSRGGGGGGGAGADDFDDDFIKERLAQRRAERAKQAEQGPQEVGGDDD